MLYRCGALNPSSPGESMSEAIATSTAPPDRGRALVLLLLAAVLWSLGGTLVKSVQWHPMAISGVRSAIAAVLIRAVFRKMEITWSTDQVGGAVAYALTVATYVVANKMTTAANVILLQYTAPLHAALFGAWFLGERTSPLDWATILAAFAGMTLFFFDHLSAEGFYGNMIALGSGLSFGWLALFLRRQKSGSPAGSIFLGNVLAALAGIPFLFRPLPAAPDWV
ncbi:MAG TPA: DMT family transporter, partial [Candidatus Aquicultoraceae bacterium]|nr:DMT family transporter [Candidatus Aquicultoraceae bacterium]